ncbi:unnamed protein product, partial [Ectocarpus sp. 4 AP-2014]
QASQASQQNLCRTLMPQKVVERLNRSLQQELFHLREALPARISMAHAHIQRGRQANSFPRQPTCDATSISAGAKQIPGSGSFCDDTVSASAPPLRANASLLNKLEASRMRALETLSSVLFDDGRGRARHPTATRNARPAWQEVSASPPRGKKESMTTSTKSSLQARLLTRADLLVQEERERLLRELNAELDVERKKLEARKPAISEEAYREAKKEQVFTLQKQEHDLRMVLARRELKDLKDAARERLAVEHAQEKEKTLSRLRRSLSRGTGHSVSGLQGELWEEAHEKRERALHEGEAAFGHSCRLLRQQSEHNIQASKIHSPRSAKIDAMGGEAAIAQETALAALREVEASITEEELSRVTSDLEGDRREAETELKRQLHSEAARSINVAVEACTSKHQRVQHKTTVRAAEVLRQALDAAGEHEVARTKAVLGREVKMLDDRRSSLISAVEEALSASSLRKLAEAEASRSSFSSPPPTRALSPKHANGNSSGTPLGENGDPSPTGRKARGGDVDHHAFPSSKAYSAEHATSVSRKARRAVRFAEGAAAAAEREYAKRARDLVRMRAAAALKKREDDDNGEIIKGGPELRPPPRHHERGGSGGVGKDSVEEASPEARGGGEAGNSLVGCGGCAVLFEANERLLQEAKARGFLG